MRTPRLGLVATTQLWRSQQPPYIPPSQYSPSKLATHPIGIADRGYLSMFSAPVVWLPVYLCPRAFALP